jgi:hypothetical protein
MVHLVQCPMAPLAAANVIEIVPCRSTFPALAGIPIMHAKQFHLLL